MSFEKFLGSVAHQRLTTYDEQVWEYYDYGSKTVTPLICIPGVSGTPKVFYNQILELAEKGYRVIAIHHPIVWTYLEWAQSFDRFLDALKLKQIHIYGVGLGAYLGQRFASLYPHRVLSLALTNGFCDPSAFEGTNSCIKMFPYLPEFYLKKYILQRLPEGPYQSTEMVKTIDFIVDQIESLNQQQLASRLTLTCLTHQFDTWDLALSSEKITLIDTYDDAPFALMLREQMYNKYPNAKKALMKLEGDFPYLLNPDEVTMHLQVHLRANGLFLKNKQEPKD